MTAQTITQVCSFYSAVGGIERAVVDLASGFQNDYQVTVLCTKHGIGSQTEYINGVKVVRSGSAVAIRQRPLSWTLLRELSKQNGDILHYHLPFPLATVAHQLVRPKARAVIASWHHDLARDRLFKLLYRSSLSQFLDCVDVITASTQALIDSTEALAKYRDKCVVIPIGVIPSRFEHPNWERIQALRQKFGTPLILSVGRLVYYKGHHELIKAIEKLDASLVIIGDGPLRASLERYCQSMGLANRVHFLGRLPDDQVADFYHACDVFALPSTLSTETFGIVQVEAMLCKKPVVNTLLPTGVPWVSVDQQTGLTVPPGDSEALASALATLLSNDKLRTELGERGRQRALENFTLDKYVASMLQLYQQVLQSKM